VRFALSWVSGSPITAGAYALTRWVYERMSFERFVLFLFFPFLLRFSWYCCSLIPLEFGFVFFHLVCISYPRFLRYLFFLLILEYIKKITIPDDPSRVILHPIVCLPFELLSTLVFIDLRTNNVDICSRYRQRNDSWIPIYRYILLKPDTELSLRVHQCR